MAPLLERFRAHLARTRLFAEPGTAVVAVSGGPDSVALLDLLHGIAPELGLSLIAAHADHQIQRGSGAVGKWVRGLAEQYGLPFESVELGLGPDASETVARRSRYRWLRELQERRGARYLVTAHQRDDQVETILWRALRGSGIAGLSGIAARGPRGLVRPLLPFAKAELAEYVAARGLTAHDDPANRDPRHARSWIRTALVPLLTERFGEDLQQDLLRLARHARADRRAWDQVLQVVPDLSLRATETGFDVARGPLVHYDPALAAALISAAARRVGLVIGPAAARRVVGLASAASGRRVEVSGGWLAEAAFDRLRIHRPAAAAPPPVLEPGERGEAVFGEYVVRWEPGAVPREAGRERAAWTTWIEQDGETKGEDGGGRGLAWAIRAPKAGDRMKPLGGVGHRSVRRLLMEARVPRGARESYPVVARGETILWVPGVCRSAADLPAPGTRGLRLDVIERGSIEADGRETARQDSVR